jgi:hypothetical protein
MRSGKTDIAKPVSPSIAKPVKGQESLDEGKRVLAIEARAVQRLIDRLDNHFEIGRAHV